MFWYEICEWLSNGKWDGYGIFLVLLILYDKESEKLKFGGDYGWLILLGCVVERIIE